MASNYGTVAGQSQNQNGSTNPSDAERAPLLGKQEYGSMARRFRKHMNTNVSNSWGDIALLCSYIITGLLDSCSVFIWGSFLSMQTGNARPSLAPTLPSS